MRSWMGWYFAVVAAGALVISWSIRETSSQTPSALPSPADYASVSVELPTPPPSTVRPEMITMADGRVLIDSARPSRWDQAIYLCKGGVRYLIVPGDEMTSFRAVCTSGAEPTGQDP